MEKNQAIEQINEEAVDTAIEEVTRSSNGVLKAMGVVGGIAALAGIGVYIVRKIKSKKSQKVVSLKKLTSKVLTKMIMKLKMKNN